MNLNLTLVLEVVQFLLLVGVMTFLLYKPLMRVLKARSDEIRSNLDTAAEERKKVEELVQTQKDELNKTRQSAHKVIEDARLEADKVRDKMIHEAREESSRVIEKGKQEIENQIARAEKELTRQVGDLSQVQKKENIVKLIAEKIIRKSLSEEDHRAIIEEETKELKKLN